MSPTHPAIELKPFAAIADRPECIAALDRIFFQASATQNFASDAARAAFHERWLGRYLTELPGSAFVAVAPDGRIAGYIVGAVQDPALDPRFADIGYFRDFAGVTPHYPAHLHINLDAGCRNQGIGGLLIEAFCDHARQQGAKGVHAVTAKLSRNRSFYARQGFALVAEATWNGHGIVLLGRQL